MSMSPLSPCRPEVRNPLTGMTVNEGVAFS